MRNNNTNRPSSSLCTHAIKCHIHTLLLLFFSIFLLKVISQRCNLCLLACHFGTVSIQPLGRCQSSLWDGVDPASGTVSIQPLGRCRSSPERSLVPTLWTTLSPDVRMFECSASGDTGEQKQQILHCPIMQQLS
jgi:hypothetical protein